LSHPARKAPRAKMCWGKRNAEIKKGAKRKKGVLPKLRKNTAREGKCVLPRKRKWGELKESFMGKGQKNLRGGGLTT